MVRGLLSSTAGRVALARKAARSGAREVARGLRYQRVESVQSYCAVKSG
jgi:hypothetical protein